MSVDEDADYEGDVSAEYRYHGPMDPANMTFPQYQSHVAQYLWLDCGYAEQEAKDMVIKYASDIRSSFKGLSFVYYSARAVCEAQAKETDV